MVAVQATGCAPMVKAWEDGVEHAPGADAMRGPARSVGSPR